jgi:hypothetical protein
MMMMMMMILLITFLQGVQNHMSGTNDVVSEVHNAADTLCLQYTAHVLLFPIIKVL